MSRSGPRKKPNTNEDQEHKALQALGAQRVYGDQSELKSEEIRAVVEQFKRQILKNAEIAPKHLSPITENLKELASTLIGIIVPGYQSRESIKPTAITVEAIKELYTDADTALTQDKITTSIKHMLTTLGVPSDVTETAIGEKLIAIETNISNINNILKLIKQARASELASRLRDRHGINPSESKASHRASNPEASTETEFTTLTSAARRKPSETSGGGSTGPKADRKEDKPPSSPRQAWPADSPSEQLRASATALREKITLSHENNKPLLETNPIDANALAEHKQRLDTLSQKLRRLTQEFDELKTTADAKNEEHNIILGHVKLKLNAYQADYEKAYLSFQSTFLHALAALNEEKANETTRRLFERVPHRPEEDAPESLSPRTNGTWILAQIELLNKKIRALTETIKNTDVLALLDSKHLAELNGLDGDALIQTTFKQQYDSIIQLREKINDSLKTQNIHASTQRTAGDKMSGDIMIATLSLSKERLEKAIAAAGKIKQINTLAQRAANDPAAVATEIVNAVIQASDLKSHRLEILGLALEKQAQLIRALDLAASQNEIHGSAQPEEKPQSKAKELLSALPHIQATQTLLATITGKNLGQVEGMSQAVEGLNRAITEKTTELSNTIMNRNQALADAQRELEERRRKAEAEAKEIQEREAKRLAEQKEAQEREAKRQAEAKEAQEREAKRQAEAKEAQEREAKHQAEAKEAQEREAKRLAEAKEAQEREAKRLAEEKEAQDLKDHPEEVAKKILSRIDPDAEQKGQDAKILPQAITNLAQQITDLDLNDLIQKIAAEQKTVVADVDPEARTLLKSKPLIKAFAEILTEVGKKNLQKAEGMPIPLGQLNDALLTKLGVVSNAITQKNAALVKPKATFSFSISPQPSAPDPANNPGLKDFCKQKLILSEGEDKIARKCHILAGSVAADQFNEIRKQALSLPNSTVEFAHSLPVSAAAPEKDITFVCLISDPEGRKPYTDQDKQMKGIAAYFHYAEADGNKNSTLCVGNSIDIDTLRQILDCCLATGRPFQFGDEDADLRINLGKDAAGENLKIVIPRNTKAIQGIPKELEDAIAEHKVSNPDLHLKLQELKMKITHQQTLTEDQKQAYNKSLGDTLMNLARNTVYRKNLVELHSGTNQASTFAAYVKGQPGIASLDFSASSRASSLRRNPYRFPSGGTGSAPSSPSDDDTPRPTRPHS